MIRWLRSRFSTEDRADDGYTKRLLDAQLKAAQGIDSIRDTSVYRACLNLISDAAASAQLEGRHSEILQPRLGAIVRQMVDRGSSALELIIGSSGGLELLPVEIINVFGQSEESTWIYNLERAGPTTTLTGQREQAGVLNFRLRPNLRSPWRGEPSLQPSNSTAKLLSRMQDQLTIEASFLPARLLGAGFSREQRTDVADGIESGGIVVFPVSRAGSDSKAIHTGSVGGEFSASGVELFQQLTAVVCSVMGCPPALIVPGSSDGSGKEAFRRFSSATVSPLLMVVMEEWRRLVGPMTFNLNSLRAADAAGIARATGSKATAVQRLVQSGMALDEALAVVEID